MAVAIEVFMVLLTLSGLAYLLIALWAGRAYLHRWRSRPLQSGFAPTISILKPLKGIDPRMYTGFVSHCTQQYDGRYEILFGVSSTNDPAIAEIERLRTEFPSLSIRLVICAERLGASGKISNLTQMLPHALGEIILVNDGDIVVSGVDGELDIDNVNGSVTLNNIAGSTVAHALNGRLLVTFARVNQKPMAFSSLNGDIDVTFGIGKCGKTFTMNVIRHSSKKIHLIERDMHAIGRNGMKFARSNATPLR